MPAWSPCAGTLCLYVCHLLRDFSFALHSTWHNFPTPLGLAHPPGLCSNITSSKKPSLTTPTQTAAPSLSMPSSSCIFFIALVTTYNSLMLVMVIHEVQLRELDLSCPTSPQSTLQADRRGLPTPLSFSITLPQESLCGTQTCFK